MKLLVATDAHIYETPDGKHWTPAIYGYSFWERYFYVFDEVRIVARTKKVSQIGEKALLVDGPGVEVFPVPFYQGPKQLIKVYYKTHKALKQVANGCDVAIFRMPSQTAQMVYTHVKGKLPIGGEIVYDPSDDLNSKNVRFDVHVMDILISNRLKRFCKEANGVSYVTENSIQKNYPSKARIIGESKNYFETYYSTITLNENAFLAPKKYNNIKKVTLCLSDVSMNTERKGEPVLIHAVKQARDKGYDVDALIIGDGSMRETFENLARSLGISKYIKFTGRLASSDEVRNVMCGADIFVFPTQAEGLPRGILEAMAIGLPVLSTPVGGIPEIIDKKYLFDAQDIDGFSNMICHLFNNCEEMTAMSANNYAKSLEFKNNILQERRNAFYKKLFQLGKR